ncbi:alpha-L-arabinofuranosidase C-terminal domain-containing protein [Rubrolithibacter danxiaensis]|uniref:alpha-L-arabinofuranosidase C-terminal domain-containing protein n=1 Tax=Rubrolithibacter danxiaensis TaxID=3390805 RepID=UPI003BF7B441
MKKKVRAICLAILFLITGYNNCIAQSQKVFTVKANEIIAPVQPTMWGIFFEDINMGADGGLYAELVKNRSFEFDTPLMGWKEIKNAPDVKGSILVLNREAVDAANRRYIRVTSGSENGYGLRNEGFRGIGIKKDNQYNFSVTARQNEASNLSLVIELISEKGEKIGAAEVHPQGSSWKKYPVSFKASETDLKARLIVWIKGKGSVDLDMISLFPEDTWKSRPGGLRADMVQLLADMKPGFLRFPGGCIVEGRNLDERFQWKKTIGNVEDRDLIINRWNLEFKHRLTPDYYQSFGLGFLEYFQLCEDIGASPLPILNCGMACQFNTAEVVPVDQLDPYIQDALDLIEFANGDITTKWGKIRAELGHPKSFNLKMMGVGNENWGEQYVERLKEFTKAIKAKYPQIKIVNSSGTDPDGERFDYLNGELRKMNADIIDEHYYRAPKWFFANANRYDKYDRNGSKVFAGEYAAQSVAIASPENKNNWKCALAEAAFMTGLERNAEVVTMASYAPLFAHVDGWQWTPDLIWVNNLESYGTPNYYVQKLYSTNKGTHVVPVLWNNQALTGQDGFYASSCIDTSTHELIVKIVNASGKPENPVIEIEGVKKLQSRAILTELRGDDLDAVNSIANPTAVSPKERQIKVTGKELNLSLQPYSFNIIRFKML